MEPEANREGIHVYHEEFIVQNRDLRRVIQILRNELGVYHLSRLRIVFANPVRTVSPPLVAVGL